MAALGLRGIPEGSSMPRMGEDTAGPPSGRRVSVDEAARALGLTVDAVRKRVQRGTIVHEKDGAGRVRIVLDSPDNPSTVQDESRDTRGHALIAAKDETIEELRDRVRALEEANRENRRVILAITSRIPQLEAPSEGRESDLSADVGAGRGDVPREALEGERELRERAEEKAAALEEELRALRELRTLREPLKIPETVKGEPESAEPRSATADSQTAPKRPWWRRVFGG